MSNQIITISRQFGSGGRTVGKNIAEKLGIPCYDQELIEMIARESGFSEEYIKSADEQTQKGGLFGGLFTDRVYDTPITQDVVWDVQKKIILELAEKGPCVIVGRCADVVLRDKADCLRVYIHADINKRMERIVAVYGQREDAPRKRVEDKDKRRKAYYEKYTDQKWGAAENFHIALDSGALGLETCEKILLDLYQG